MIWLLDTNVVIHAARARPAVVAHWYREAATDTNRGLVISAVTIAELWYGAAKDADPAGRRAAWHTFLGPLGVAVFDRAAAEVHGQLRHALRHAPIGERDLIIAATALAHGYGVVTANMREFSRVPGLAVEDWTAA